MPTMPPRHRPPGQPTREQALAKMRARTDQQRPSPAARGYDGDWRRCRRLFIEKHPVCCTPGCGKATTDVDHLKSPRERPDLRLSWSNLRPFCHSCHSARTARDQGFGRSS